MSEPVGYIGLGIMGGRMARNLLAAGHSVVVWNRTPERAAPLVDSGARLASDPEEVAREAGIILVCVSDTPDVEEVVHRPDGILAGLRPGSVVVDHSTISPSATRRLAEAVSAAEGTWLDAPVSGGSEGAERGTLSIMVGGDTEAFARVHPYLQAYGTTITHLGPAGAGQTAKLVNQILVVLNALGISEALLLAEAAGIDLETVLGAVSGGAAGSWMLSNRGSQMIARDWRPGFTIDLQLKDLRLVLDAADELGVPTLGTSLVFELYRSLQARGLGGDGNHALVKALEALSGIELGRT